MPDENAAAQEGAFEQQGTDVIDGQPEYGTEDNEGQPDATAQTEDEPSGEASSEEINPEQLNKDYKALQTEFNSRNEQLKTFKSHEDQFEQYGGFEEVLKVAEYLSNNKNFQEWIEQEQQSNIVGGLNLSEADEETQKAVKIVSDVARDIFKNEFNKYAQENIQPLAKSHISRMQKESFSEMDTKYPDWREMKSEVEGLIAGKEPTTENVEDAYWKSVRNAGKLQDVMAKTYQRSLEAKKKKSTDRPRSANQQGSPPKAKTIAEAAAIAEKSLGRSFG